jgi:site-specific DNA recombinase
MKIAIYARKSKTSDKGESIDNQIDSCKDYITRWSSLDSKEVEFIIYKDEGFSGSNIDRPQFKTLLKDAKKGLFNMLICYRLDRVSRNIADFSNTYELLQENNIEFVSVKEQFDTSTPIGRAMLNIAMVFAQLERETIAERIKDNMRALARTGRWLGGKTPTGFTSEPTLYLDNSMNQKKMFKLSPEPVEIEKVHTIFDTFLELKSLRGVESHLFMNDIYSKNECKYTASTIKDILVNPVYVAADEAAYTYLSELGCDICNVKEEFNGKYGLIAYNRTEQSNKRISASPSNWIIAIGKHAPTIQGSKWVYIQTLLKDNTHKNFYTKKTMDYGLLTNLIKCKHCGATMKIKKGKVNADGNLAYTYVCSTKEMSKRIKCNVKNVIGQDADQDVLEQLVSLSKKDSFMMEGISSDELSIHGALKDTQAKLKELETELVANEQAITNLMKQLSTLDESSPLCAHFMKQLETLDKENLSLKKEIKAINTSAATDQITLLNLDMVKQALNDLGSLAHTEDIQTQRARIRTIIDQITWDGESLKITLFGKKKERS